APRGSSARSRRSSATINPTCARSTTRSIGSFAKPVSRRRSRCPSRPMRARPCTCARTPSRPTTSCTARRRPKEAPMTTRSDLEASLKKLRLFGCLARLDELENEPWLTRLVTLESEERTRRSLENRTRLAGLGSFKALCDFDWVWPKKIDRPLVEELFTLRFVPEGANVVLLGPN